MPKGKYIHKKGKISNNWKGGRSKKDGYILIWSPTHPHNKGGYVAEHRLIMEKHIGRILTSKEVVHHINCVVDDNRIENLQLFANNNLHLNHHKYKMEKEELKDG